MKELMKKTIDKLKEKIKNNLFQIQNNQIEIRELLKQSVSSDRLEELEDRYSLNKMLLSENSDFVDVQLTLVNFIEKYNFTELFSEEKVDSDVEFPDREKYYKQTISGQIAYDVNHPYYCDDIFFRRLLHYFESIEDYEKCSKLVQEKIKDKG